MPAVEVDIGQAKGLDDSEVAVLESRMLFYVTMVDGIRPDGTDRREYYRLRPGSHKVSVHYNFGKMGPPTQACTLVFIAEPGVRYLGRMEVKGFWLPIGATWWIEEASSGKEVAHCSRPDSQVDYRKD